MAVAALAVAVKVVLTPSWKVGSNAHSNTADMSRHSIVLFGDSITQGGFAPGGWAARVAERYVRRADVFNRGLSGYNTRWARAVLPALFEQSPPFDLAKSLVTVFFGANDAAVLERNRWVQPNAHAPDTHSPLQKRAVIDVDGLVVDVVLCNCYCRVLNAKWFAL